MGWEPIWRDSWAFWLVETSDRALPLTQTCCWARHCASVLALAGAANSPSPVNSRAAKISSLFIPPTSYRSGPRANSRRSRGTPPPTAAGNDSEQDALRQYYSGCLGTAGDATSWANGTGLGATRVTTRRSSDESRRCPSSAGDGGRLISYAGPVLGLPDGIRGCL